MSELKDIFGKRKHPNIYSDEIIPTESEIRDIVTQAYPLVTSFRKAFAYEIHVLGPNKERSNELWKICEGHKQKIDEVDVVITEVGGTVGDIEIGRAHV